MAFFVFVKMGKAPLSRVLREIKQLLCVQSLILYYIKQIDSMLPCICPVIDHRGRQNVVRTSVTHSAIASCATFLFLPHFDVICDLLLDRCTATWNLFVKMIWPTNSQKQLFDNNLDRMEHHWNLVSNQLIFCSTGAYRLAPRGPLQGAFSKFTWDS